MYRRQLFGNVGISKTAFARLIRANAVAWRKQSTFRTTCERELHDA